MNEPTPWIPGPLPPEDPTTKISLTNDVNEALPFFQTTERVTDKPTGRGARASNENWIKLPFPAHDDAQSGDILTPPQTSGDLINSRMPRVNFVTQNKVLEASESRNDKASIQRATRTEELRTEFVRPEEEDRAKYKPVYPRQAVFYPDEPPRPFYDDRYIPMDDVYRRADPYYVSPSIYNARRFYPAYPGGVPRVDRYDDPYVDNAVPRKPKRIIYYAHLPEVVRTPPSVDLRYRYSVDPYRRFDDDVYARNGRYDYRFRNSRYPYAPLRKEERNYRDSAPAASVPKDKKIEEKVTPTPILPQKDDKSRNVPNSRNVNVNRNLINSHQYHDSSDSYSDAANAFHNSVRSNDGYLRFEEPLFQTPVDDPYQRKY